MFARAPVVVPETPVSKLGRSIRVGDDVAIEVDGQLVAGAYLRRRVIADATSVRQVVVLRLLGLEREATYDVESITRVEPIRNERERERYALAQVARRRLVAFEGKPTTIQYAAHRLGIGTDALTQRLQRGWSRDEAFTRPGRGYVRRTYRFRGRDMTAPDIAREIGMPGRTLDWRLRRNDFDLDRALGEPYRPHPHK